MQQIMQQIALASSSPRRRELLGALGFDLIFLDPNIDESAQPGELPADLVLRLAKEKAQAVALKTQRPIIAADTIVLVGEEVFGKPENRADAYRMIRLLSGREHFVLTGYAVLYQDKIIHGVIKSSLIFRDLFEHEIQSYLDTGDWAGKSGACTLQGGSGPFVEKITGSLTNILGLPLTEVLRALEEVVTPTRIELVLTT